MERTVRRRKLAHQYPKPNHEANPKLDLEEDIDGDEEVKDEDTRDWAYLTAPLLLSIITLLTTIQDFFAFRGVCRNWRFLCAPTRFSLSSQSPVILLSRKVNSKSTKGFYDITKKCLYKTLLPWGMRSRQIFGYSCGHLIAGPSRANRNFLIYNLFTGVQTPLPQAPTPNNCKRVILSSPPSGPDCLVILFSHQFYYCRIGDEQWIYKPMLVIDMYFLNKKLYVLTHNRQLGIIDFLPTPKLTLLQADKISGLNIFPHVCGQCVLAELDGELLVVCARLENSDLNYFSTLQSYVVWRWDFKNGGKLIKMCNLGKRALFIGYYGFAGCASSGSGIKENCIYDMCTYKNRWIVYSLEDGSIDLVSPTSPDVIGNHGKKPPVWIIPSQLIP